jgi:hypothetical protein
MTKRVVIENAKCDCCGKKIAPGQAVYTMSIDFTSYLTVSGKTIEQWKKSQEMFWLKMVIHTNMTYVRTVIGV